MTAALNLALAGLTPSAKRAVTKYGADKCRKAYRLNRVDGEGAHTVSIYLGLPNTRAADAAINAGEELEKLDKVKA